MLLEQEFEILVDIYYLDCSMEEKELIMLLFQKYKNVFLKDDDDIGCIDIIKYQICFVDSKFILQQYCCILLF